MKLLLIGIAIAAMSLDAAAQNVGVNTDNPASTLHVVGKPGITTLADGITIPALTGDQLKAKDATYTTSVAGTLVYITTGVTSTSLKTTNVTAVGFYYFDGSAWQKTAIASTTDNTDDAFVNDSPNNMVKLGTRADGVTPRSGNADFVIKDDGSVGIGTLSPSVLLDVAGKIAATEEVFIRKNTEGGQIVLEGQTGTDAGWTIDQINNQVSAVATPRFRIFSGTDETKGISIKENGNVGLGTSSAAEKLTVSGGNVSAPNGWVRGYATGQLLNTVFVDDPALINLSNITSSAFVNVINQAYTPVYNNSRILVQYHNNNYTIGGSAGTLTDEFQTQLVINGMIPTVNTQTCAVGGNANTSSRSGTLFPIAGVATNTVTTPITIQVQIRRSQGDDGLTFNGSNGTLIIQEIAN